MIADAIYANDNQRLMAQWYGAALTAGLTVEQIRSWPDRIRLVTADAVREAARRWLDKRRSVTGYLIKETRPEEKHSCRRRCPCSSAAPAPAPLSPSLRSSSSLRRRGRRPSSG